MTLTNIDNVLFFAGAAGHIILLLVMLKRKLYRDFPIFLAYLLFSLLADPTVLLCTYLLHVPSATFVSSPVYLRVYYAFAFPEYLLGLAVLFEIARNVLVREKRRLPPGSFLLLAALVIAAGLVTFFMVGHGDSSSLLTSAGSVLTRIGLINAVLRIASFVAIALFAEFLGVGWKNHVLQLATGLAFYGAVDLIVRLAHSHITGGASVLAYHTQFRLLDELRVVAYLSTLIFWCWSFSRQEAPRREFSPQMAAFMVSIAAVAKKDRSQFGR
ncbi:MAG TPA: hypothetical protein VGD59_04800 [Acidisarcina sp.]